MGKLEVEKGVEKEGERIPNHVIVQDRARCFLSLSSFDRSLLFRAA